MIFSQARINLLKGALAGSLLLSVVLGGALAWSRHELSNAKEVIQSLVEWQDGVIEATRLAADSPEIAKEDVAPAIQNLGQVRIQLLNAVDKQNEAIEVLIKESEAARELAAQAQRKQQAAIRRAEDLQRQLRERANAPAADMEAAIRRNQDDLYEAGL